MKKLATTFGLLALMLVVTSFTSPNETGGTGQRGGKGTGLGNGGNIISETGGTGQRGGKGTSLGNGGNIFSETGGTGQRGGKGTGLGNGGNIQ